MGSPGGDWPTWTGGFNSYRPHLNMHMVNGCKERHGWWGQWPTTTLSFFLIKKAC